MKPHPRIRKAMKWGGAAVTSLVVVVWIGSAWLCAWWIPRVQTSVGIANGCVVASDYADWAGVLLGPRGMSIAAARGPFCWGLKYETDLTSTNLIIPLWPACLMVGLATCAAWHLDTLARRRERVGRCPKCNYDRAGPTAGAVCPECGAGGVPSLGNHRTRVDRVSSSQSRR